MPTLIVIIFYVLTILGSVAIVYGLALLFAALLLKTEFKLDILFWK
ncbi:MAG: hypothetical protein ACN6N2_01245 [Acinetobacter calcoaceticus]